MNETKPCKCGKVMIRIKVDVYRDGGTLKTDFWCAACENREPAPDVQKVKEPTDFQRWLAVNK